MHTKARSINDQEPSHANTRGKNSHPELNHPEKRPYVPVLTIQNSVFDGRSDGSFKKHGKSITIID